MVSSRNFDEAYAGCIPANAADADAKLALIGLPKAGAYLLSAVARNFGWHQIYWHVREGSMKGSSAASAEERHRHTDKFHQCRNIAETAAALPAGAFFVGHIAHSESAIAALSGFRKILAIRELRGALVSCLAFERRLRRLPHLTPIWRLTDNRLQMSFFLRQQGPALFEQFLSILPWMVEPGVLTLRFEDLRRPDAGLATRLAAILWMGDMSDPHAPHEAPHETEPSPALALLHDALVTDTLMQSSGRSDIATFWSEDAEALFTAFGGGQLNKAMGYRGPYGTNTTLN